MRKAILLLPLFLFISCQDNIIGDPAKNIGSNSQNQEPFPDALNGTWYNNAGSAVFVISNSTTIEYVSTIYTVVTTIKEGDIYKIIAQSNSSNLYYAFFFENISSTGFNAERSSSYSTAEEAATATVGSFTAYSATNPVSSTWTGTTFPSTLIRSWYSSSGTVLYTIPNSSSIQYASITYSVVATYRNQNSTVYKMITYNANDNLTPYTTFFFTNISSSSMSAYRSGSYQFQSSAEAATPGSYTTCSSQAPSPWQTTSVPSSLQKSWYSSGGSLVYSISGTSSITYNSFAYTVVAAYVNGSVYKVIGRYNTTYYAFFFTSITSSGMSSYRSSGYTSQAGAEGATAGSYTTYSSQAPSPWQTTSVPSSLQKSWYTSSGSLAYTISGTTSITYSNFAYTVVAAYVNGSTYKVIGRYGSSYYAFFFTSITSSGMSAYRSGSYSSQSSAEGATAGTYTTYTSQAPNPWQTTSFPASLVKIWNNTSGYKVYYLTSTSSFEYNGSVYSVVATYVNGSVYKVIGLYNYSYYAFFFTNISSGSMSAYRSSGYSSQASAEAATAGSYSNYYVWQSTTFPSSVIKNWHFSNGSVAFSILSSSTITFSGNNYTVLATYVIGSVYKVVCRNYAGYYMAFFFSNISSTTMSYYQSSSYTSQTTAEIYAAPGTPSTVYNTWPKVSFPSQLSGSWYTSGGLFNYYISGSSTIQTNNIVYTILDTYYNNGVYKVITSQSSTYHTFFFTSITSTQMYVTKSSSYSSYYNALGASPGSYTYHHK